MEPTNQQATQTAERPRTLRWLLIIAVLIVLAGIGVGYYYFFAKKPDSIASVAATQKWTKEPGIILSRTTSSDTHKISDTTIRTYYMGNGKIESVESTDGGKTFSEPVGTGIAEDPGMFMSNPAVLEISNGNWIMVYEQQPQKKPGQEKGPTPPGKDSQRNLYLATSTDGKSFQKVGIAIDSSKEDNFFASVPDLIKVSTDKIRMYYVSGGEAIASADSSDGGKTWTRNEGFSLKDSAVDPDVVYENGQWTMYYSILDPSRNALHIASSKDGLNWKAGDKILDKNNSNGAIVDPDFFEFGGQKIMFFGEFGTSDSTAGQEQPNLYRAVLESNS